MRAAPQKEACGGLIAGNDGQRVRFPKARKQIARNNSLYAGDSGGRRIKSPLSLHFPEEIMKQKGLMTRQAYRKRVAPMYKLALICLVVGLLVTLASVVMAIGRELRWF